MTWDGKDRRNENRLDRIEHNVDKIASGVNDCITENKVMGEHVNNLTSIMQEHVKSDLAEHQEIKADHKEMQADVKANTARVNKIYWIGFTVITIVGILISVFMK